MWVEVMPGVAGRGLRWPPHLGHGIRGHLPWTGSPVANGRCAAPAGVRVSPECTGTGACAWDEGPSPTATRTGSAWCSLSSRPLLAHMLPCPKPRRSPPKATRIVAGVGRGTPRCLHFACAGYRADQSHCPLSLSLSLQAGRRPSRPGLGRGVRPAAAYSARGAGTRSASLMPRPLGGHSTSPAAGRGRAHGSAQTPGCSGRPLGH